MVKAFLFDYDGVTTAGAKDILIAQRLAKNLDVSQEDATTWLQPIWSPLLSGRMTIDQAWIEIERCYGRSINTAQRDIWFSWDELRPLPEMIELVRTLKSKGYPVGLLSNVMAHSADTIRRGGGYDEFDFLVLSCEVGSSKPDPQIYNVAIERLGHILPEDIVFLDDRKSNIVTANSLGIKTILVESHVDAVHQVRALIHDVTHE